MTRKFRQRIVFDYVRVLLEPKSQIRHMQRADICHGLLPLACALICRLYISDFC